MCTTTRKLRSQRHLMIDSYVSIPYFLRLQIGISSQPSLPQAQYEFLHRAIVNYADLHKSSLDSITSAVAES